MKISRLDRIKAIRRHPDYDADCKRSLRTVGEEEDKKLNKELSRKWGMNFSEVVLFDECQFFDFFQTRALILALQKGLHHKAI